MKFQFLLFLLLVFSFACDTNSKEEETEQVSKPNIIYILADDLGYGDVSANNPASKITTTHIDRLAKEGMRFTDAHSPSSVCTPTRYGILTGRYCWRSRLPRGVLRGYGRALIAQNRSTVASILQKEGYATGVVGKWHLGLDWVIKEGHEGALTGEDSQINELGIVSEMNPEHIDFTKKPTDGPLNHGFDYSFILPASLDMDPYCYLENDSLIALPTEYTPGNDLNTGYTEAFWRAGKIAPDFKFEEVLPTFTSKSLAFIEERAAAKKPFFLYLPLAAPHTPWVPKPAYKDRANAGNYGDFVKMVDDAVGQILDKLEELGLTENSLVIFTSDNGPFWTPALVEQYQHKSVGPLRGMKADAWDGGHRIPHIVRWPEQIKANSQSDASLTLTHVMATVADILNLKLTAEEGEDSHSIWPVLTGTIDTVPGQEAIIHHSSRAIFAIRKGDWKLIEGRGSGGFSEPRIYEPKAGEAIVQLYNLNDDIAETNNLYLQKPEIVAELRALLDEIRK